MLINGEELIWETEHFVFLSHVNVKSIYLSFSYGLGIENVHFFNWFVTIKWQILSSPVSSPTNLSPWNTAIPRVSIWSLSDIGILPAV